MDVNSKKNLVGLIHHLGVGGAERMMVNILNHFSTQGFHTHLIIFNYTGALKEELSTRVIVHDLQVPSVMKGMPKCLKKIHSIKPDIVFTGIGHLNIAMAPFIPIMRFFLPQTKWISRETNIVSLQNQTSKYPKLFDWLYKHTYNNYDVIVAQSEDMKNDLETNYLLSANILLINNPVDIAKVEILSNKLIPLNFNKSKINLLTVAGLREEKRHDLMLKVMAILPEQYHLTIVGSGDKAEELKVLSKDLKIEKRIHFEGQQSNPYPYMKNADLFLLTSQREGFPNVLLEANCTGLPIVAFACLGGIKEIINEGINGFFVPFEEIQLMAKKIEEAMLYKFDKISIQNSVQERYSKEIILDKYAKIFKLR